MFFSFTPSPSALTHTITSIYGWRKWTIFSFTSLHSRVREAAESDKNSIFQVTKIQGFTSEVKAVKAKRGDYCSVTRARRRTEKREEGGVHLPRWRGLIQRRRNLSQKENKIQIGIFPTPAGLAEQKNSEVVFRRSEIENSTSEVDGCGNEEIGRRTLPLSEMLKSS